MRRHRRALWIALPVLALLLPGCARLARFTDTMPLDDEDTGSYALYGERAVGQTFLGHHAGLDGIGVLLTAEDAAHEVVLHLRASAESDVDLALVTATVSPSGAPAYVQFPVPLQEDANGVSLYLHLEAPGATAASPVVVPYSTMTSPWHTLWLDGETVPDWRLAYQLHYRSASIVKDLARQVSGFGLRSLGRLLLTLPFYLLPGGALVVWLLRDGDWIERTITALCTSVAVYVLLVYATLTGLRLNRGAVVGLLAASALAIAVRVWLDWRQGRLRIPTLRGAWRAIRAYPSPAVLAFVSLLVVGVRVWVTRDMLVPRWADSVQHTVMVQLMLDHGGLFESWEPYAPYTTLTMHFGFHANAAAFHWLSGLGAIPSVIWVGQMLNALAALALYPLGKRVGGRWAGILAVLVSGLLTTTPMVYANWGRYPQLAGLVLLPIGGWLLWRALDADRLSPRLLALIALCGAGQALAYYRVPYYFAAFAAALVVVQCVGDRRLGWAHCARQVGRVALVAVATVALLIPWGLHISESRLADAVVAAAEHTGAVEAARTELKQWAELGNQVPLPLLVLAGFAVVWAAARRRPAPLVIGLWATGLFVLNVARWAGLPGTQHLTAFAATISVYVPASIVVAWLGVESARLVCPRLPQMGRAVAVSLIALVALLGAYRSIRLDAPRRDLVTQSDLEAMAWIRENAPSDARFLVNGFMIYEGYTAIGYDAGWWLPLLAGRANTMPPEYALLNEQPRDPGYSRRAIDLVRALEETPVVSAEGVSLICQQGITHLYVGEGRMRDWQPVPSALFTAEELLASDAFAPLHNSGEAWVFELLEAACP